MANREPLLAEMLRRLKHHRSDNRRAEDDNARNGHRQMVMATIRGLDILKASASLTQRAPGQTSVVSAGALAGGVIIACLSPTLTRRARHFQRQLLASWR